MSFKDLVSGIWDSSLSTFGREVLYQPAEGSSCLIRGVFDETHRLIDLNEAGISTVHPTLGVKLSDLETPPESGDQLLIDDYVYEVSDVQTDGQGGALLILKKI